METIQGYVLWSDEFQLTVMLVHQKEVMFRMALTTYSLNIGLSLADLILTRNSEESTKDLVDTIFFGRGLRFICIERAPAEKRPFQVKYERELSSLLLHISHFDASSIFALGYPLIASAESSSRGINASILQLMVLKCESGDVKRSQHLRIDDSLNKLAVLFIFSTYNMPSQFLNYTKWRHESLGLQRVWYYIIYALLKLLT